MKRTVKIVLVNLLCLFGVNTHAQCDFVGSITGLTQTTPSTANSASYTQTYVLVDCNDEVYATSATPDFL
ncbi:MAG: hypothetical protein AAF740_04320, partial [Bacteroidota bacterium]